MRILLDECVPAKLAPFLVGHDVRTVRRAGWAGQRNGELRAAAGRLFDVIITVDQSFIQTPLHPDGISVITLKARTNRVTSLLPLVPELLTVLDTVRPGKHVRLFAPES